MGHNIDSNWPTDDPEARFFRIILVLSPIEPWPIVSLVKYTAILCTCAFTSRSYLSGSSIALAQSGGHKSSEKASQIKPVPSKSRSNSRNSPSDFDQTQSHALSPPPFVSMRMSSLPYSRVG